MDALFVLAAVALVPIGVGGALAAWTRWPRILVALIAGMPLPLAGLIIVLVDYADVLSMPPEHCGLACGIDRALDPAVAMSAGAGMVIAVIIAFVTAMIVRRRRAP